MRTALRETTLLTLVLGLVPFGACDRNRGMPAESTGKIERLAPELVLDGAELYEPVSVAFDAAGGTYVLDAGNHRLYWYSSGGELQGEVGREGQGVGEFPFLTNTDHVFVSGDRMVVVMGQAQRINVWTLPDWSARSFRIQGFTWSAAFDGEVFHLSPAAVGAGSDLPAVQTYSADGDLVGGYGERRRLARAIEEVGALRSYARTLIAMSPSGRVYEAMRMWPTLRAFDEGELVWDRWYDFGWLDGEPIAEVFARPQSLFETLTRGDLDEDEWLRIVLTLSIVASNDAVVTLLAGSYVQVYSPDGVPGRTYQLLEPTGDSDGSEPRGQSGWRMGLGVSGRLCVAETLRARVLCYELPDDYALPRPSENTRDRASLG